MVRICPQPAKLFSFNPPSPYLRYNIIGSGFVISITLDIGAIIATGLNLLPISF